MPFELAQLGKHVFFWRGLLVQHRSMEGRAAISTALRTLGRHPALWSLGVEEQFYILWPVLLWLIFRLKAKTARSAGHPLLSSFAINVALSACQRLCGLLSASLAFLGALGRRRAGYAAPEYILTRQSAPRLSIAGLVALLTSVALFTR